MTSLEEDFNKYLREVKVTYSTPDKRDPDYQFFGTTSGTINIYRYNGVSIECAN